MSAAISEPGAEAAETSVAVKKPSGGGLGRYVLIRFLLIIPTIFILTTLVFFLMRITGDPITAALGGRLTKAQLAERVHAAGYDRPILVQYFEYMGNLLKGDFGTSVSDGQPVSDILLNYGAATVELVFYALIVAFIGTEPACDIAAYSFVRVALSDSSKCDQLVIDPLDIDIDVDGFVGDQKSAADATLVAGVLDDHAELLDDIATDEWLWRSCMLAFALKKSQPPCSDDTLLAVSAVPCRSSAGRAVDGLWGPTLSSGGGIVEEAPQRTPAKIARRWRLNQIALGRSNWPRATAARKWAKSFSGPCARAEHPMPLRLRSTDKKRICRP